MHPPPRSRHLRAALRGLLALCFLILPVARAQAKPPNVIVILTDDMGSGDLGCYGGTVAQTPHIDRMAAEGTRFTRYYSASPICSPSRCGLITGQCPARWRITSYLQTRKGNRECGQADYLSAEAPALPRALKAAGYATAHIGKWHLGGGRDVDDAPGFAAYGYDEAVSTWESPEPHPDITATDWIWSPQDKVKRWERTAFFVDKTLAFLARHPDQPCFVNLWPDDPHTPWVPEARTGQDAGKGDNEENLRRVLEENDRQIGRLLEHLPENTLVVYVADNGARPTFGGKRSLGRRGSKLSLYEGGVRLPCIVRWPGHVPAGRVDEITVLSALDLFPSLCALTGAPLPDGYKGDGEDRSQALLGVPARERLRPLFWEYGRNDQSYAYPTGRDRSPPLAIRDGQWKLLTRPDGSGTELYDVLADPDEKENIVSAHPDIMARLRAPLLEWWQGLPQPPQ